MTTSMRRWPFWLVAAAAVLNVGIVASTGQLGTIGGAYLLPWVALFLVGAIITARVPGNNVGPLCLAYGILVNLSAPLFALAEKLHPTTTPWYEPVAWAINTAAIVLIAIIILRFPTGRLVGPWWRVVELACIGVGLLGAIAAYLNNGWGGDANQARIEGPIDPQWEWLGGVFFVGIALIEVAAVVSLAIRYRRAMPVLRAQLRWLLYAAGISLVLGALAELVLPPDSNDSLSLNAWISASLISVLPVSVGIAIVRHRLYDIDVIISRTLVYGSIFAVITGIYVAVVSGGGWLIGAADDSPGLRIGAAAVIAIVFHPARVRLERLANRIVFGRRATPYEVLSEFTQRVAATDEQLLVDIARLVADGTVATAATLWTLHDGMLNPVSAWPKEGLSSPTAPLWSPGGDQLLAPGADEIYAIQHEGTTIGVLGLKLPTGESLPPGDRALMEELTAGVGLALWNRELTGELRASIDELQSSRRRLVAVQDKTRHRLERDLHDGAQQRLVALRVRLSIARQMAEKAQASKTADTLAGLCDEADEAIEALRDFARGVYPPLLEAEGLGAALEALAGRLRAPIDLSCELTRRHSREVEAAVYFALLELLTAVEGSGERGDRDGAVAVVVFEEHDRLTYRVSGDGIIAAPLHIEDRFEALGGLVWFDPAGKPIGNQAGGWLPAADSAHLADEPTMVPV